MPRLSIVVPYTGNERSIHSTLLSVLENRPEDCEIVVAHDGSYRDPYRLLNDEVLEIEILDAGSTVKLINEAVLAACAPVVQTLIPGTTVEADWTDEPLALFDEDPLISGVMLPCRNAATGRTQYGFDMTALPRRIDLHKRRYRGAATPAINGTFIRRKVLRALDGLMELPSVENSEIEFGLAMRTLGLEAVMAEQTRLAISVPETSVDQKAFSRGQVYGRVALAYSKIDESGVEISSVMSRLSHLAGGLMKPSSVAERLGWVLGLTDTRLVSKISNRIAAASDAIEQLASDHALPVEVHAPPQLRRAA